MTDGSFKKELVHHEEYATRAEAKASLFESVAAFDNRERRHSALGSVAPTDFERAHHQTHRSRLSTIRGELQVDLL